MPVVEFVGQSRRDSDFPAADSGQLINCYREPIEDGHQIKSVLGTVGFANLNTVFMRAMEEIGGFIYCAAGGKFYKIGQFGAGAVLGTVTDGETTISGNNGKIAVASGGVYTVWSGMSKSTPTGGAFSAVGSVEFIGQVTVMTELNGRRFQWSAVANAASLGGLDFATAEGRDDNIIRAAVVNGNLWLMKEKSCEIWYPTTAGFSRIVGGVLDTGLKSFGLVTKIDGGAFFVGDDNIAYITNGASLQPVSVPPVETDISQGAPRSCFYYEDEGHKFCVVQFTDRMAWVYDLSTGEWHRRAKGVDFGPWLVTATVKAFGEWHVGDDLGKVQKLRRVNSDVDGPLHRRMTSRTLRFDDVRVLSRFEVFGRAGDQEITTTRPPRVMLRASKDGGRTWGADRWRDFGQVGEYRARTVWRALGAARQFAAELTITDPLDLPVLSKARMDVA